MVFSSPIFLFFFLPIVLVLYRVMPGMRAKNILLLISSLIFYAFGQIGYLSLFLVSILGNTFFAWLVARRNRFEKAALIFSVVMNLGLLCVFKYLDLLIQTANTLFGTALPLTHIPLPIGISFFTFQGMAYVIDVYRDKSMRAGGFLKSALYISLFPQLVAGPIVIYRDIADQIDYRKTTPSTMAYGIRRFIVGLSKKLLIANTLGAVVDTIYGMEPQLLDVRLTWIAAIFYALQIYFDFSGYSDMALGIGRLFGFTFLENFNYPYISRSIKEFWRRWHISLSSWFKDYLYIPLGGNRKGRVRSILNKLIVFLCTGLWHGASWTFLLWGLWHGFFIAMEGIFARKAKSVFLKVLSHIYLLLVVLLGFVLFRAESLSYSLTFIQNMFTGFFFLPESTLALQRLMTPVVFLSLLVAIPACLPIKSLLSQRLSFTPTLQKTYESLSFVFALALMVVCMLSLSGSGFNPFIYFQF